MPTLRLLHRTAVVLAAILLLCPMRAAVARDENAHLGAVEVKAPRNAGIMPYAEAYTLLARLAAIEGREKVRVRFRISSQRPEVKTSDIRVSLQGNTIYRDIPVSGDGDIEVPLIPEALADEAQLVSNQPDHTLRVEVTLEAVLADPKSFRYADAGAALEPARHVVRAFLPGWLRWLAPDFNAIVLRFERAEGQTVTVLAKGGDQVFRVDNKGQVVVPIDPELHDENPWVAVSHTPLLVTVTRESRREPRILN